MPEVDLCQFPSSSTAPGDAYVTKSPQHPSKPPIMSAHFQVKANFIMSIIGATEGKLVVSESGWYFETTPREIVLLNFPTDEEGEIVEEEDYCSWNEQGELLPVGEMKKHKRRICKISKVKPTDSMHFSFDVPQDCKSDFFDDDSFFKV